MPGRRILVAALLAFLCLSPCANAEEIGAPAQTQNAQQAVGVWIGTVSWNARPIEYAWYIEAGGTFESGRVGRGANGGGVWSIDGSHLILKYANGFQYEGELSGDGYGGTAYRANRQALGGFSMSRAVKSATL